MPRTIAVNKSWFEHILNCLANQKYIRERGDSRDAQADQAAIDAVWDDGMAVLDGVENGPWKSPVPPIPPRSGLMRL